MRTGAGRPLTGVATGHDLDLRMLGGLGRQEPAEPDAALAVPRGRDPVGVVRALRRHHDRPRSVGLVLDLGAIDGHALVVVVVGVQKGVPQAHVPEHALGGAARG